MNRSTNKKSIKAYSELIPAALPALKKLLDVSASRQKQIAPPGKLIVFTANDKAPVDVLAELEESILANENMDVINTICVIEIIGRQYLYPNRKSPFKNPEKMFKSWADDLWEHSEKGKNGTIKYICDKVDMREYILNGMRLLGISLKEEKSNG
jgi:hypothetical protein